MSFVESTSIGLNVKSELVAEHCEAELQWVDLYFHAVHKTLKAIDPRRVLEFADLIAAAILAQRQIFVFGNGGSAATASHFCGDLVKCIAVDGKRAKAICLNDNTPSLMAYANDMSYADIFAEPLKNYLQPDDLVIGFSGSGNSENVVRALTVANQYRAKSIAVCGYSGGRAKEIAQFSLHANIQDMEISEDTHLIICHCVKRVLMSRSEDTTLHIDF